MTNAMRNKRFLLTFKLLECHEDYENCINHKDFFLFNFSQMCFAYNVIADKVKE